MEPSSHQPPNRQQPEHNRNLGGLVLILIGVVFLLHKIPATGHWVPYWLFSWPSILIVIGLYIGAKTRFRNVAAFVLLGLGGFFLLEQTDMIATNLRPYLWPLALIIIGIILLARRNHAGRHCNRRGRHRYNRHRPFVTPSDYPDTVPSGAEDLLEVNAVFGNIERSLISKNFKGGNISATFGGAEVNLSKCDFQGTITIDLSVVFGGAELILPSNWQLKNDVNVIMGGIEDKRNLNNLPPEDASKVLILRGSIICGGLEIKSF